MASTEDPYDFIVIGAGPAGLQMSYFLDRAGRNYVTFEAQPRAGSFFATNPRNRQLLSINKRFNHYAEKDYNLRHDWNSLLSDDDSLLFTKYSEDLYPHADDLHRYLNDFADRTGVNVRYQSRVALIGRDAGGEFRVELVSGEVARCRRLIIATGCVAEYVPEIEGIELATTYATHSMELGDYENKKIAILGGGNSAFEVADYLSGVAAAIHVLVREPVKHAWQSHYVGDLRAVNNNILDMYQLKSLHATLGFQPRKIEARPEGGLRVHLEEDCPHWSRPGTFHMIHDYDHVIACAGWRYVLPKMFEDSCRPAIDELGRFPVLSEMWESSVEGMFFAGTVTAARDRRAASGFIHGFRYNTRTLFRLLMERYHDEPLPATQFAPSDEASLRGLAKHIIERVSVASALYQMNGLLVDVLVTEDDGLRYIDELPIELIKGRADLQAASLCITVSLEYGFDHYPSTHPSTDFIHPSDPFDTRCSAFLHPVLRTLRAGQVVDEMHLGESLMIRYDDHFGRDSFGPNYTEVYARMNEHKVMNYLNAKLGVVDETFSESHFDPETFRAVFREWTPAEIEAHEARQAERTEQDAGKTCKPG